MRTSRPSNESTLLAVSCATQLGYHAVLCADWLVPISGRLTDHLELKDCFVSNFRIAKNYRSNLFGPKFARKRPMIKQTVGCLVKQGLKPEEFS